MQDYNVPETNIDNHHCYINHPKEKKMKKETNEKKDT